MKIMKPDENDDGSFGHKKNRIVYGCGTIVYSMESIIANSASSDKPCSQEME